MDIVREFEPEQAGRSGSRRGEGCRLTLAHVELDISGPTPARSNTDQVDPSKSAWIAVCDDCDVELNRTLLQVVGVPPHVLEPLLDRYKAIQGDIAYDHPDS